MSNATYLRPNFEPWEIPGGAQYLTAKRGFQEVGGGGGTGTTIDKLSSMRGLWIFSGTTQ